MNRLRILRIAVAAVCFVLLAFMLLDWGTGAVPVEGASAGGDAAAALRRAARPLVRVQLIPAVLSLCVAALLLVGALTLLFGRIYCSALCPLGVLQDGVSRLSSRRSTGAALRFGFRQPIAWLRYGVLALTALLIAAGVGAGVSLVDPYSIFGRMIHDGLRPLVQGCNNFLAMVAGDSFGREPVTVSWLSAVVAMATVAIIGVLAWRGGRSYCNSFCPVGTLLGEVSRAAKYKIRLDAEKCVGCGLCERACKGSCIDVASHGVDVSRCVVCFDCIDVCPHGAIAFACGGGKESVREGDGKGADMSRRRFLTSLTAAAVAVPAAEAQRRREGAAAAVRGNGARGGSGEWLPVAPPARAGPSVCTPSAPPAICASASAPRMCCNLPLRSTACGV